MAETWSTAFWRRRGWLYAGLRNPTLQSLSPAIPQSRNPSYELLFREKFDPSLTIVGNPVGPRRHEFVSATVAAADTGRHYPARLAGLNVQGMVAYHDCRSQICANGFKRMDEMSPIGFGR
jgi:hypothetical protein